MTMDPQFYQVVIRMPSQYDIDEIETEFYFLGYRPPTLTELMERCSNFEGFEEGEEQKEHILMVCDKGIRHELELLPVRLSSRNFSIYDVWFQTTAIEYSRLL